MRHTIRTLTLALFLCLASLAQAAPVRWVGQASDVKQQDTITVANVWAADDTIEVAINNAALTITVGDDIATTDVAQIISRSINASSDTENLLNNESRTRGGQEIPEFRDVVARVDPDNASVVLVESRVAGVPFETAASTSALSVTETTAGTGTSVEALAVSATGRQHFDNDDNWSTGSVPSASDELYFDSGPSVLYGMENALENFEFYISTDYTGDIGLPAINPAGYREYRVRFLAVPQTATTGGGTFRIGVPGSGTVQASGRRYFDLGTADSLLCYALVYNSGPATADGASVQFVGGLDFVCEVFAGTCAISTSADETATQVAVARTNGPQADLQIGDTATFTNAAGTIECNAGRMATRASLTGGSTTVDVNGGQFSAYGEVVTVEVRNGTFDMRGAQITTVSVFDGGVLDLSQASASLSITNDIELSRGFTVRDPRALYQSDYDFNGCTPADGQFQIQSNVRLTLTPL